jgi:hypothetical protein
MKLSVRNTLAFAFLTPALAQNYNILLFSDYYCQDEIYNVDCYSIYDTCETLGVWWNSYQIVGSSDQCDSFAGDAFWDTFFIGFGNCGLGSATLLGGGCGQNQGCQQTMDLDTFVWKPACSIGCFEDFSISGVGK